MNFPSALTTTDITNGFRFTLISSAGGLNPESIDPSKFSRAIFLIVAPPKAEVITY